MLDKDRIKAAILHYINSNLKREVPKDKWNQALINNIEGCFNYLLSIKDLGITEQMRDVFMVAAHIKFTMTGAI